MFNVGSKVLNGRFSADLDTDEMVAFLIGMRLNKPLRIASWVPVALAMPKMVNELYKAPDLGFLGGHAFTGLRTTCMVQYWESADKLNAYAASRDNVHLPAWRAFNNKIGESGSVGVWHETYKVRPGTYEGIYVNMPEFGLAKATTLTSTSSKGNRAVQRMADGVSDSEAQVGAAQSELTET